MAKKQTAVEYEQLIGELTADLQRLRADFENYRKRVDGEKAVARQDGEERAIVKLLPVIDTIERAVVHIPADIADHQWVKGVAGLAKQLEKTLNDLQLAKIDAGEGTDFNPELHQAVQFEEAADGDREVIATELQPGYTFSGKPIRHSMVKVTRK